MRKQNIKQVLVVPTPGQGPITIATISKYLNKAALSKVFATSSALELETTESTEI